MSWIFFRAAPTFNAKTQALEATALQNACAALKNMSFLGRRGKMTFDVECVAILAVLALVHWLNFRGVLRSGWRRLPDWACATLLGIGTVVALLFVPVKYKPFVYFQF